MHLLTVKTDVCASGSIELGLFMHLRTVKTDICATGSIGMGALYAFAYSKN